MSFVTTQPEALSASAGTLWGKAANVPPSLPGGLPRTAGAAAPQAPAPRYGQIPTVMAPPPSGGACMALAGTGRLSGYQHHGFWKPSDTFNERAELDADYNAGLRAWKVWEQSSARRSA
jgi:hypothetical protein